MQSPISDLFVVRRGGGAGLGEGLLTKMMEEQAKTDACKKHAKRKHAKQRACACRICNRRVVDSRSEEMESDTMSHFEIAVRAILYGT
jgi:hypothetical protein